LNNEIQTTSEQALNGYKEGQDMASDVVADIFSGIAAVGIYTAAVALAPVSGGASIAVGIAAATASGAAIKTGIKFADTVSSEREYTSDNLKRDLATGAFSGVLAPITGGMGGAVGKTVATKMGVQAVKQVGKEVADTVVESSIKQGIKTALTNPTGYEYVGGTLLKRSLAFGAEMATDGAIGGAVDNAFRTAYDGGSLEDVGNATVQGFVGGAIMSPIIGGGMKVAGKGAQKIFGKENVQIDAQGNRVRVNDDGTVVRIDENGNEIDDAIVRNTDSEQLSITDRLTTASSREEFVAIRDEIKAMPAGAEKTALQQEYLRKYNEFSRKYNEEFDIRMEYKPKEYTQDDLVSRLRKLQEANPNKSKSDIETENYSIDKLIKTLEKNGGSITEEQIRFLDLMLSSNIDIVVFAKDILPQVNKHNLKALEEIFDFDGKTTMVLDKEVKYSLDRIKNIDILNLIENLQTEEDYALMHTCISKGYCLSSTIVPDESLNFKRAALIRINKLTDILRNNKKDPDIVKHLLENDIIPDTRHVRIVSEVFKDLPIENKNYALQLSNLKNKNGDFVLFLSEFADEKEMFDHGKISETPLINFIKEMSENDFNNLKEIINNTSAYAYQFKSLSEIFNHAKKNYPNQFDEILNYLQQNIVFEKPADIDDFMQMSVIERNRKIELSNNNQEILTKYPIKITALNDDYINKAKLFIENKSLVKNLPNHQVQELISNFSLEQLQSCFKIKDLISSELMKRNDQFASAIFQLGLIREYKLVTDGSFNDFINAFNKLEKISDDKSLEKVFQGLSAALGASMQFKTSFSYSKNIDYILSKDLTNMKLELIVHILASSDIDFHKNEKILNDILGKDKEVILKTIKNKCQNTCPNFVNIVESLLNDPEKAQYLLLVKDLSTETMTNDLYSVAKLFSFLNDKPQDYINGSIDNKVLSYLKQERKNNGSVDVSSLSEEEQRVFNRYIFAIQHKFDDRIPFILDCVNSTDLETTKLLLDKRLDKFTSEVFKVNSLPAEKKELLSNIIRNGKRINKKGVPDKLTGQQKTDIINIIQSCNMIEEAYGIKFDYEKYMIPTQGKAFIFKIDELQKDLFHQVLFRYGFSEDEISKLSPENLAWDLSRISLLSRSVSKDEGELAELVTEATRGHFKEFINDPTNPHGKANLETKTRFEELGLDYTKWQTGPEAQTFKIGGQEYTVKLWNRVPQESLFDGSYTTCCTALDGGNGGSMANYMLNTAINVVEVKDKNGKIVAMSRCCIAEIEGKQTLIIENIEANNQLIARMEQEGTTANLVDGLHNYLKDFASMVGGDNMPVYMSTKNEKVRGYSFPEHFEEIEKKMKLTGRISKNEIYLNTYGSYVDANNLTKPASFYIIRK